MKWTRLSIFVFMVAACTSTPKQEENSEVTEMTEEPNQLTDTQKAEGWKLLFDGKSTAGWQTYKNKESNSWKVEDGVLHCVAADSADKRADLRTVNQYSNFALAFDWKIGYQGNSGVIYRATEEFDEPYLSGPEYQLLDDVGYPGEWTDKNMTAANYDMHAAENKKLNPQGEWNTSKIVVNGNHVEHWLNGGKVVEYEFGSDDWKALKDGSKWKEEAGYGMASTGYIDLQDHGGEVWFRNIMIKEL
jgi:hypothetical protein